MPILWINAGGTIVSEAYDDPKTPPENVKPLPLAEAEKLVHETMQSLEVAARVDGFAFLGHKWDHDLQPLSKDSKQINDNDITSLAEIIKKSHHRLILITHGTDWMAHNASKLKHKLQELNVSGKTVLFTGAMVPLSMKQKHRGDAAANLEYVFKNIDSIAPGVNVVGRNSTTLRVGHMDPDHLVKNTKLSRDDLQLTFSPDGNSR